MISLVMCVLQGPWQTSGAAREQIWLLGWLLGWHTPATSTLSLSLSLSLFLTPSDMEPQTAVPLGPKHSALLRQLLDHCRPNLKRLHCVNPQRLQRKQLSILR